MGIKSLISKNNDLANAKKQLQILNSGIFQDGSLPNFETQLSKSGAFPMISNSLDIFQINLGYMCNQICKHCHVDAGPDRTEIMTKETMQLCLDAIKKSGANTVDLTGGAPEMNPNFRWFVQEINKIGVKDIIVRSNLTIIKATKKNHDLPDFFKQNNVHVISSLPFYNSERTDKQRGNGVFRKSIDALKMLNKVGYGKENSALKLDLVYNPAGAFLPGDQKQLELDFKKALLSDFNIEFNELFCITNLPISRFLDYLIASENYEDYMETLVEAYNPLATDNVMCKNTISVSWDGYLYDCDFNQMLHLNVNSKTKHLKEFDLKDLVKREIVVSQHCYGCTAGAGSSCQGATV